MPDGDATEYGHAGAGAGFDKRVEDRGAGKCGPLPADPGVPPEGPAGGAFEVNLDQLRDVVNELALQNADMSRDRFEFSQANAAVSTQARDIISADYAATLRFAMSEFLKHNETMSKYCSMSVDNLAANVDKYSVTDLMSALGFRDITIAPSEGDHV
jgi:hypothetical protein